MTFTYLNSIHECQINGCPCIRLCIPAAASMWTPTFVLVISSFDLEFL